MKITAVLLLLISLSRAPLLAAPLPPEVSKLCAEYDAKGLDVDADRNQALVKIRDKFLQDLVPLERAATTRNDAAELASIAKLKELVPDGPKLKAPAPPEVPAGLSQRSQKAFSDYLTARAAIDRQFEPLRQKIYGDEFLKKLTALESALPADAPARADIARIKANVVSMPKYGFLARTEIMPPGQPGTSGPPNSDMLIVKAMDPASPATLAAEERCTLTIGYKIPGPNRVRIAVAPYKGGVMVPSHWAAGSTCDPGEGEAKVHISFKNVATVDEVRIVAYDEKTDAVLGTTKAPVQLTWTGILPTSGPGSAASKAAETQAAQAEAVRRYPAIAQAGSEANRAFLAELEKARQSNDPNLSHPNWPLVIAIRSQSKPTNEPPSSSPPPDATPPAQAITPRFDIVARWGQPNGDSGVIVIPPSLVTEAGMLALTAKLAEDSRADGNVWIKVFDDAKAGETQNLRRRLTPEESALFQRHLVGTYERNATKHQMQITLTGMNGPSKVFTLPAVAAAAPPGAPIPATGEPGKPVATNIPAPTDPSTLPGEWSCTSTSGWKGTFKLEQNGDFVSIFGGKQVGAGKWSIAGNTLRLDHTGAGSDIFTLPMVDGKIIGKSARGNKLTIVRKLSSPPPSAEPSKVVEPAVPKAPSPEPPPAKNQASATGTAKGFGLTGAQPFFLPGREVNDMVGIRYTCRVVANQSPVIKIIFGWNRFRGAGPDSYLIESNLYANGLRYEGDVQTTWPMKGDFIPQEASLRMAVPDYNKKGKTGARTLNPVLFPRQAYLVDGIRDLPKTDLISQANLNGEEVSVEIQRGKLVKEKDGWKPGGELDGDQYRQWDARATIKGKRYEMAFALPEAGAQYLSAAEIMHFCTEFMHLDGLFKVQFWDAALQREGRSSWQRLDVWRVTHNDAETREYGIRIARSDKGNVLEFSNDNQGGYLEAEAIIDLASGKVVHGEPKRRGDR